MDKPIHLMSTSPLEKESGGALSPGDQLIWDVLSEQKVAGKHFLPQEVSIVFTEEGYTLFVGDEPLELGGLIVRLTRGVPERAYEIASAFEKSGGVVSDPVQNLIYPGGKLTPFLIRVRSINFVPTFFFNKNFTNLSAILHHVSYPFILKPQGGFQGKGVALIQNENEFTAYIEESVEENLIAQEYIADIVEEFRVIVVGGRGLGVVRKVGEGLAKNSSQGAIFEHVDDSEVLAFAEKASQLGSADVYGTDVVRTTSGILYLIENNRAPNFMAFRKATGIEVEREIVDFVLKKLH